jgi:TPR repeat protein
MYSSYKQKYLKYKIKYKELINQNSGNPKKTKPSYEEDEEHDVIEKGIKYEDSVKFAILTAIRLENEYKVQKDYVDEDNYEKALNEYVRAYDLNYEEAIENILIFKQKDDSENTEALYKFVKRIESDYDRDNFYIIEDILKLIISKNNFQAALYLGKIYEKGYKVEKNISKAIELYEFVKDSKDYKQSIIARKRIYNINNNIIYTCKEKIIKIYILALLQGYNYIKIKSDIYNDYYGDRNERHSSKKKIITRHNASSIFINNYILYTNDFDVMLEAVKQDGLALEYATDNIKKNFFIVLNAVNQNGLAIQYASLDLKKNKDIIKKAITQNGIALQYALNVLFMDKTILDQYLLANRDIFLIAIKQNGLALKYASDDLKNDKEIVKNALEQNGLALKYVSDDLKNDKEIVKKAVEQNGLALEYATDNLKNNLDIVLIAIKKNSSAINFTKFKNDLSRLSWLLYNYNTEIIKFAEYNIQDNYDVIMHCVKKDGLLLEFASNNLKNNKDIVLAAINQNFLSIKFASFELSNNSKIIFTFLFRQRNFLFLLKNSVDNYSSRMHNGIGSQWNYTDEQFHREYPNAIPMILPIKFVEEGLYSYNSLLYKKLLGIIFNNKIPSNMCIQNNNSYINHLLNNSNVPSINAANIFINALQDQEYIREYISIILKCCKIVSSNFNNKIKIDEAIISVKNHQFKYNNFNKYYKFIGFPEFIKDKILCYSSLLKHLIKKIYQEELQSNKKKYINKLIIDRCINIKTLQTTKKKYFLDEHTDNFFLSDQHLETI